MTGTWTDERIAQLRELFGQGLSAGEIAERLLLSRNAVIGKLNRLQLLGAGKRKQGGSAAAKSKPGTVGSMAFGVIHGIKAKQKRAAAGPVLEIEPDPIAHQDAVVPMDQRLSLLELNATTCHWPIGNPQDPEFFFCGGKALAGLPYCAGHSRLAYRPRPPRSGLRPGGYA